MNPQLEICCFSLQSALNAQEGGANRIELCDNMFEGGTTPSFGLMKQVREKLTIDVNVIIRPRGGDFLYTSDEFSIMENDILKCKEIGVDGVVFGILLENGEIDRKRALELVKLANPMSVTFHRAIDMSNNLLLALKALIEIGVDRVLTSGGKQTAWKGKDMIRDMVNSSNGLIKIMAGSGVNENNIVKLCDYTNAHEFHFSAKQLIKGRMKYKNPEINMGGLKGIPEYDYYEADINKIKRVTQILNYIR